MNRGIATFTLDYGKCPKWLFERMVNLSRPMLEVMVDEYGPDEVVARLGDPVWFQSLGTVLAFDWNASGLTTILTAALKEAIRGRERELGVFICGGKGKTSRKTPTQIRAWGNRLSLPSSQVNNLEYNSRMSAKVDSSLVQDGFDIYHHTFFFSRHGAWTVVQQGMNQTSKTARRYHWHSRNIKDLIIEPHSGISTEVRQKRTLNLTSKKSADSRQLSLEMLGQSYSSVLRDLEILDRRSSNLSRMVRARQNNEQLILLELSRGDVDWHPASTERFSTSPYLRKIIAKLIEVQPKSYEDFISMAGVGSKTVRALALVGEVLYGAKPSYQDPARYSFAHGGKDGTPFPVDRSTYDKTITTLRQLVQKSRLSGNDKDKIQNRLNLGPNQMVVTD